MNGIGDFFDETGRIMNAFGDFVAKYNLSRTMTADYINYNCAPDAFDSTTKIFDGECCWIYFSKISGAKNAVIRLRRKVKSVLGDVGLIELSEQRHDYSPRRRFNHFGVLPVLNQRIGNIEGSFCEIVHSFRRKNTNIYSADEQGCLSSCVDIGEGLSLKINTRPLIERVLSAIRI